VQYPQDIARLFVPGAIPARNARDIFEKPALRVKMSVI